MVPSLAETIAINNSPRANQRLPRPDGTKGAIGNAKHMDTTNAIIPTLVMPMRGQSWTEREELGMTSAPADDALIVVIAA
eukprot:scaffold4795_cov112-Cylindrotheca_fusiformis.AAC.3